MPIYEYACTACGRHIDVVHGIHAQGPSVCTECGGAMKKALTAPAIHFKGSGWAKKDARSAAATATPAAGAKKDDAPPSGDPPPADPSAGGDSPAPTPATAPATPAPAATAPVTSTPGS